MLIPDLTMMGGPYASVLDVGGNIGDFAKAAYLRWPDAQIVSFEPLSDVAQENFQRAQGRWQVSSIALGASNNRAAMRKHKHATAVSTLMEPGSARAGLGIEDEGEARTVNLAPLDDFLDLIVPPCLLKIDVEGYELHVLQGATHALDRIDTVVVEVQNDPHIFEGSPSVDEIDGILNYHGLRFTGLAGAYLNPRTDQVMQYDGVWTR